MRVLRGTLRGTSFFYSLERTSLILINSYEISTLRPEFTTHRLSRQADDPNAEDPIAIFNLAWIERGRGVSLPMLVVFAWNPALRDSSSLREKRRFQGRKSCPQNEQSATKLTPFGDVGPLSDESPRMGFCAPQLVRLLNYD